MHQGKPVSIRKSAKDCAPRRRRVAVTLLVLLALLAAAPVYAAADLVLVPTPVTLISLIVLFIVAIFPLNALIYRPIFATLDERHARTAGAREKAAELSEEADQVLSRYRREISEARSVAEQSRKEAVERAREEQARVTASARSEAEQQVERGRVELNASLEQARSEMGDHVRDLADSAAQKILGRAV